MSALQTGGKIVEGVRGGLKDVYVGRFKDGLSEDDSILDTWQIRNTNAALLMAALQALSSRSEIKGFAGLIR